MSKFKILLLGLVVGFVSIGSFSNSSFFGYDVGKEETILTMSANRHLSNAEEYSFSIPSGTYDFDLTAKSCGAPLTFVQYRYPNGTFKNIFQGSSNNVKFTLETVDGGYLRTDPGGLYNCSAVLTIKGFVSADPYSGALTPAINGLHSTVIELIPYVIYIGIGVLLFMLGFIAVRWLVNWISGKIKGIFISKRR